MKSSSLLFKCLATKHTTVKWTILSDTITNIFTTKQTCHRKMKIAQWLECSTPTAVALILITGLGPHKGWVWCCFSSLLWEFYPRIYCLSFIHKTKHCLDTPYLMAWHGNNYAWIFLGVAWYFHQPFKVKEKIKQQANCPLVLHVKP